MKDPYEGLTPRQASVRRYFVPTPAFPNIVGPVILGFLWSSILGTDGAINSLLSSLKAAQLPFLC